MLYLIPTPIGSGIAEFPSENTLVIKSLKHFIVEDVRTARRFISSLKIGIDIDSLNFYLLNEHTRLEELSEIVAPLIEGEDMGLMSEAGLPCVADPGRLVVQVANDRNIKIKPLVGPSSIMMALMVSGASGQNFKFNGYIPVKPSDRISRIRQMESEAYKDDCSQIFIEAPYRNQSVLESLFKTLKPSTMVTIAENILTPEERLLTKPVSYWKSVSNPVGKNPAVFIISKPY